MTEQGNIHLTVPDVDFDGIELAMALKWARRKRAESQMPPDVDWDDQGRHAVKILEVVAAKYDELLGGSNFFGAQTCAHDMPFGNCCQIKN